MLRSFAIVAGLIFLLGAGLAVAALPRGGAGHPTGFANAALMDAAYARVETGVTPVSGLLALGFDTGVARRLSQAGLMEAFMPKDSISVDALSPALQNCLEEQGDCAAYVFTAQDSPMHAILLAQGGRVMWKTLSGARSASWRHRAKLALY